MCNLWLKTELLTDQTPSRYIQSGAISQNLAPDLTLQRAFPR